MTMSCHFYKKMQLHRGGMNYVHLQNKYRKEDFQNIIYFKLRKKQNNTMIKIEKI